MSLLKRKQLRLKGYDYSQNGAYHITICTKDKEQILCNIVGDGLCAVPKTELTDIGKTVEKSILHINGYPDVSVDKYAVMPDHVHILISICNKNAGKTDIDIPEIIKRFKSYTANSFGDELWQRSYNDHIIRGQADYDETWQYIDENPLKWNLKKTKGCNLNG
ncbi:MAG: transposase [Clostridia bacterium]|nr:transposase [Clostridia bacterium]